MGQERQAESKVAATGSVGGQTEIESTKNCGRDKLALPEKLACNSAVISYGVQPGEIEIQHPKQGFICRVAGIDCKPSKIVVKSADKEHGR